MPQTKQNPKERLAAGAAHVSRQYFGSTPERKKRLLRGLYGDVTPYGNYLSERLLGPRPENLTITYDKGRKMRAEALRR